jgi:hypothetical protein
MPILTMVIKVDDATGQVISITDEYGNPAQQVPCESLKGKPLKHAGAISHFHTSPGCICYDFFGTCFQICTP